MPGRAQQSYEPQIVNLMTERFCWSEFPELSGKGVVCMAEDSTGHLWFGTEAGIYRYNGLDWTLYSTDHGLPDAFLRNIQTAPDGSIYCVYETSGVYAFRDSTWHRLPDDLPGDHIYYDILPVGRDSLWIATSVGALFHHGSNTTLYRTDGVYPLPHSSDNVVPQNSTCDIYHIYQDQHDNLIWINIAAPSQLIFIPKWRNNLHNKQRWQFIKAPTQRGDLVRPKIIQSSSGEYWIYTYSEDLGIYRFKDPASPWDYIDLTTRSGDNVILSAMETHDRVLWFGGNGYLYSFQNGELWNVHTPDELNIPIAPLQLLQTRNGAVWLAILNVSVHHVDYAGQNWQVLEQLHYQCENDKGERYFIAKNGHIVVQKNDSTWQRFTEQDGLLDMPLLVLVDFRQQVWAAGSHKGIAAVCRLENDEWKRELFADFSWSIGPQSAVVTPEQHIWFGSMGDPSGPFRGGCIIYTFEHGEYRQRRIISPTATFNRAASLTHDTQGRVWNAATHLLYFEQNKWNLVQEPLDLQKGWLDHVIADKDGGLWVAKGGVGVYHLQDSSWTRYSIEDGLPSNMVTFLENVPNGILAATDRGISRFDGTSWIPFTLPRQLRIPRESGALVHDRDNRLWINLAPRTWYFRAVRGTFELADAEFRTIRYKRDNRPPDTRITIYQPRLVSGNQYVAWHGLDPWGTTPQEDMSFSYRLNDDNWSPFVNSASLQLLDVATGDHTFQVRARDRDGNVDPTPASISFVVIPPIWQQPWFLTLLTVFSATIITLLVILGVKNKKLSEAKNEIERIATFKERFFLNLSHEFRTPLTMILAPLSRMLENNASLPQKLTKHLHVIRHHAQYLMRIVNQLLAFKQIESGTYRLNISEYDLYQTTARIKELFDWFAETHAIQYELQAEPTEHRVWFDKEKYEMILMNLIGNAFKFTQDGGRISVHLSIINRDGSQDNSRHVLKSKPANYQYAVINVKDTGVGIPPEKLPGIFDRFYVAKHPGKLYYDGIGVGLDLTKEIVELHHGEIRVSSVEQKGTTFTVHLPVDKRLFDPDEFGESNPSDIADVPLEKMEEIKEERRKLQSLQESELQDESAATPSSNRQTVLIVEDHPDLWHLLVDFFEPDYQTLVAEDGERGLELALEHIPDIILSDVMMPNMDGIDMTRALKTNPITSHIPIILLSVKSDVEHRITGLETGADVYVAKPFELQELDIQLKNLLTMRERLRQRFGKEIVVQPRNVTVNNVDAEFLQRCINVVEEHISDPEFHVDQFCKEIGMSRTQAYQKVKSISGFPLNEFIIHLRLKRAAQLLVDTDKNISEIAYSLAFSDHAHFTRHFRRAFQISPKDYRKSAKN